MANTMRWRYGDTNPVMLPVDASTVIEVGDLVFVDSDDAKPASSLSDQGTTSLNQTVFRTTFAGIAMQASAAGQTAAIRVATTGVFEFDCDAAAFDVGDLLGPAENSGGVGLESQKLASVPGINNAIGRCARRVNPAGAKVLIDAVSTLMKGGAQAAA